MINIVFKKKVPGAYVALRSVLTRLCIGLAFLSASVFATPNVAVNSLVDQARQHLELGDLDRADLIAQRIVRIDSNDARGWSLLAEIRLAQGDEPGSRQYRAREQRANRDASNLEYRSTEDVVDDSRRPRTDPDNRRAVRSPGNIEEVLAGTPKIRTAPSPRRRTDTPGYDNSVLGHRHGKDDSADNRHNRSQSREAYDEARYDAPNGRHRHRRRDHEHYDYRATNHRNTNHRTAVTWRSNDHNRSLRSLVPPGYFPPPGLCRIWYYDRSENYQPPPGNCRRLRTQLPFGARLLIGR